MNKIVVLGFVAFVVGLTFFFTGKKVVDVLPPDKVVPIEKPTDVPAGHVGEGPSANQPQPVYPPDVVEPEKPSDESAGHVGEPPFANQPQPVYPEETVPLPDKKPVITKPKPKPVVKKPKPEVKKPKKCVPCPCKKKNPPANPFYPRHF